MEMLYLPYVSKYVHLGTTIYTTLYRNNVIDVVNKLYKRTHYLLSDFSLLRVALYQIYLIDFFCMSLYSCQTWRFNNKTCLKDIHVAWRKCIRSFWKINSKTHDLLHHINNCLPMDILLEKRCIKFIYNNNQ